MSNMHGRVMNLQDDAANQAWDGRDARLSYKTGHRDARHAAAEVAAEGDALIAELVAALELLLAVAPAKAPGAGLLVGAEARHGAAIAKARAALAKARGQA